MGRKFNGLPIYPEVERTSHVVPGGTDFMVRTWVRTQDSEGAFYLVRVMERFHCEENNHAKRTEVLDHLYQKFMVDVWQAFMFTNVNIQIVDSHGEPIHHRDPDQSPEESLYAKILRGEPA